jgi:multiple sugar transport system permease protein
MLVLAGLMIPFYIIMIPLFRIIIKMGLADDLGGIIIVWVVWPFGIFMMRQFMYSIPDDLLDAGRIDGCSEFGIYFRIVLPQVKPALAVLGLFAFMWSWNDLLWPLIVINSIEKRTLPLGIATFALRFGARQLHLMMATSLISIIPVIIVFILVQKRLVRSIILTGMKI